MVWPLSRSDEEHEADVSVATKDAWKNIPPTPGAASWAIKAIPTIFWGTPKPKENDSVFKDITNSIDEARRNGPPSTPKEKYSNTHNGKSILKTPGTAGPAKNVSFAHFEHHESDLSMSPSVRKSSSKIDRIRSGLPANFPGKFPSPWTPKVDSNFHYPEEDEEVTAEDHEDQNDEGIGNEQATVETIISLIEENNKKLEQLNNNSSNSVSDSAVPSAAAATTTTSFGSDRNYEQLLDELRQQNNYAMDYAKLRDQEVVKFRAELAELTEKHTALLKDYESKVGYRDVGSPANESVLRQLEDAETVILSQKEEMNVLQEQMDSLKTENQDLKTEYHKLSEANAELETENTVQKNHNSDSTRLRQSINELNTKIHDLERENNELRSRQANGSAAEQRISSLQDEYKRREDAVMSERDTLRAEVDRLKSELATAHATNSAQLEQLQRLDQQHGVKMSDQQEHAKTLSRKLHEKDSQISRTEHELEGIQRENETLKRELAESQRTVALLQESKQQLSSTVDQLKQFSASQPLPARQFSPKPKSFNSHRTSMFAKPPSHTTESLQQPETKTATRIEPSPVSSTSSAVKEKEYLYKTYPQGPPPSSNAGLFDDIANEFDSSYRPQIFARPAPPAAAPAPPVAPPAIATNHEVMSPVDVSRYDVTMKDPSMSISQSSFEILGDVSKAEAAKQRLKGDRINRSLERIHARREKSSRGSSKSASLLS